MTTNTKKFTVFSDPGHAWAKVSLADLNDVGLSFQQISGYSYFKGSDLYLEEDRDLGLFVSAYRAKYGQHPTFVERRQSQRDSFIRKLTRVNGIDSSFDRGTQLIRHFQKLYLERFGEAACG